MLVSSWFERANSSAARLGRAADVAGAIVIDCNCEGGVCCELVISFARRAQCLSQVRFLEA